MSLRFCFDRRWPFDATRDQLWTAVSRTRDYPVWWTFLAGFDCPGLIEGTTTSARVRAPLGYTLTLLFDLVRVDNGRSIKAHVRGDLAGEGLLELDEGSMRLVWNVQVRTVLLKLLAVTAAPVLRWSHERLISAGIDSFRRRALGA